jgi:cyanate lyase
MSGTEETEGGRAVRSPADAATLEAIPYRRSFPSIPPADPPIYQFYELLRAYGTTWEELIEEEFGNEIMFAIDFGMQMARQPDQKGDRVKITLGGKILPYRRH